MIDARKQIREALLTVCDTVKMSYPSGDIELPLVTYAEVVNAEVSKWQVDIEYQVDVYHNSFADLVSLVSDVDDAMTGLGFNRTYSSSDYDAKIDTDLYQKTLSYSASVDTNTNNIFSRY